MKTVALLKSAIGSRGGLEKVARRFIEELIASGCIVTLLTTVSRKKPLPELPPEVRVITLSTDGPFSFLNLLRFDREVKKWLKKNPQDIVFGFDRNSTQTHIRAGNGCHAAYLKLRKEGFLKSLSFKINPLHHLLLKLEKRGFESKDLKILFTNSHLVKKQILTHYTLPPEKIEVLHNAVEWDYLQKSFDESPHARTYRRKLWDIPEDHFVLLFAGHGYKRKGLSLLLEALKGMPKVTLLVVGKDKNAAQFQSPNAIFFGAQESLIPFLQTADALCIPSLYDPFANVTIEALAMGLFVCTSALNGGAEILTPSTGVVIEDLFDKKSFKKALEITLAHPKTESSAQEIRKSVKDFDFGAHMKKMVERTLSYAK